MSAIILALKEAASREGRALRIRNGTEGRIDVR
jgi:hypothetical protein